MNVIITESIDLLSIFLANLIWSSKKSEMYNKVDATQSTRQENPSIPPIYDRSHNIIILGISLDTLTFCIYDVLSRSFGIHGLCPWSFSFHCSWSQYLLFLVASNETWAKKEKFLEVPRIVRILPYGKCLK